MPTITLRKNNTFTTTKNAIEILTSYVIHHNSNRRITNIRRNKTAKSLLASRIPQLQSYLYKHAIIIIFFKLLSNKRNNRI